MIGAPGLRAPASFLCIVTPQTPWALGIELSAPARALDAVLCKAPTVSADAEIFDLHLHTELHAGYRRVTPLLRQRFGFAPSGPMFSA